VRRPGCEPWPSFFVSFGRASMFSSTVSQTARVIRLAVAPAFLVGGVASFLSVRTNSPGRVIDHARTTSRARSSWPQPRCAAARTGREGWSRA
jgi:hypothetical protein